MFIIFPLLSEEYIGKALVLPQPDDLIVHWRTAGRNEANAVNTLG